MQSAHTKIRISRFTGKLTNCSKKRIIMKNRSIWNTCWICCFYFCSKKTLYFLLEDYWKFFNKLTKARRQGKNCFINNLFNSYECDKIRKINFWITIKVLSSCLINTSSISYQVYQHCKKISEEESFLIKKK